MCHPDVMDGTVSIPPKRRRMVAWIVWCATATGALVVIALLLWFFLPRSMPDVVIRWSPWVEPVLRAYVHAGSKSGYYQLYQRRVDDWGAERMPELTQALRSGNAGVRCEAISILDNLAYRADLRPTIIPLLLAALADPDRQVVISALGSLGGLAQDMDKPGIPGLAQRFGQFLRSDDPEVREEAMFAMMLAFQDGRADTTVMPLLLATLLDERPEVRHAAAEVVSKIEDHWSVRFIIATMGGSDVRLRRAAVVAAGSLQLSEMSEIIEALGRLYETADAETRIGILRAFENIGETPAISFLIRASVDPEREVRLLAVKRMAMFAGFMPGEGAGTGEERELRDAFTAALAVAQQDHDGEVAAAARAAAALLPSSPHREVTPAQPQPIP